MHEYDLDLVYIFFFYEKIELTSAKERKIHTHM